MSEFILGDCLEYMRKMPDNAFDLACCDPPYGDCGSTGPRFGGMFAKSIAGETTRPNGVPKHECEGQLSLTGNERERERDEQKPAIWKLRQPLREIQERPDLLDGQEERGRRSTEKNHSVGRSPGRGIFQRTLPRLTKPDYLGGQLFRLAADKMLRGVAQDQHTAQRVFDVARRICVDEL